jgi:cellulose synthase/poly-beta-1,6-N-acetylglucosamine synthase-like glycosyltransferase
MTELILVISIYLIIFNSALVWSLRKLSKGNTTDKCSELALSVVISVKNEENNLSSLIEKLKEQSYPRERFEVIFVDDNSTDSTYSRLKDLISDLPNFSVLKADNKVFNGKRGALQIGIEKAKFEYILITDGDCKPDPGWIAACYKKFSEGFDFIFGLAPFFQTEGFTNSVSCFENLRSTFLTFSAAQLGIPYSAAARNFGFRKVAFHNIGGFNNTVDTISGDDDLLLREAVKNRLKIGIVIEESSSVFSNTKENLNDYFNQKARHTSTSYKYLFKHKLFLGLWHIPNIAIIVALPLYFYSPYLWIIPAVKLIIDLASIETIEKQIGYKFTIWQTLFLQVVYELFLILHLINAKTKKIEWKEG